METKRTGFNRDIQLERRFARTIKAILGLQFICQDVKEDLYCGTDFLIFNAKPLKVGVRLRRFKYLEKYSEEFTIRYSRPSGVKTELAKIREGLVDYILYGFVDSKEERIIRYFIGDLSVFRYNEPEPIAIKPNNPHDSDLGIYRIDDLPSDFLLKTWRI